MTRKQKVIITVLLSIIFLLLCCILYSLRYSAPWSAGKLSEVNEKITIDKEDIELNSYLYDDFAKAGFLIFTVPASTTREGLNSTDGFGKDDRFELYHIPVTGRREKTIKYQKHIKIYYQFLAETDNEDNNIYLYDKNSGKIHDVSSAKGASGSFTLKNNVKSKKYHIDENFELYLSEVCTGVISNDKSTAAVPGELSLCNKDGSVLKLIQDSKLNDKYIAFKNTLLRV